MSDEATRRGRKSRRKGRAYEQAIVRVYVELGIPARRGFQFRDRSEVPDVVIPGCADLWIECKRYAKCGLAARAYRDAKAVARGATVIVHLREDRGDDLVVVSLRDWLLLAGRTIKERAQHA